VLRREYGVNARVAMRLAHGWGQADAAEAWNRQWPDEPKTFKNFSYWENWPGDTGYMPSLATLDRLAQLYECDVSDLLSGWGEHNVAVTTPVADELESEVLAWQVEHLSSDDLARIIGEWSGRLTSENRRSLLLKLSTAAAIAAHKTSPERAAAVLGAAPNLDELAGLWDSTYSFFSTGREAEFSSSHQIGLRAENGRLVGRSMPEATGTVELDLAADGLLLAGTWTERTAPNGYYRGAVYHGIMQLVLDPAGRSMTGQWLGPDKHFAINAGPWNLTRSATS